MPEWWRKGTSVPIDNLNFLKILQFYLIECPVSIPYNIKKKRRYVSEQGMAFEQKGWIKSDLADYGDDDELDLLLEVCNCFGMTENDIFEWLDYGLSCAEIEEILMEPRAFRNG